MKTITKKNTFIFTISRLLLGVLLTVSLLGWSFALAEDTGVLPEASEVVAETDVTADTEELSPEVGTSAGDSEEINPPAEPEEPAEQFFEIPSPLLPPEAPIGEVAPENGVEVTDEVIAEDEGTIIEDSADAFAPNPTLTTDKDDYHPGDTATIFGRFFAPVKSFVMKVFGSDDNDQNYTETVTTVTSDEQGAFSFDYVLDALYRPFYEVVVSTLDGEKVAETWFRDSAVALYDQCSNDDGDGYANGDTGCRFVNGNLNAQNSTYFEGDATPQRLVLEGLAPGETYTFVLEYGTTKGGKHAYDFLTTWNKSESWITDEDRCDDIPNCELETDSFLNIPEDPAVPNTIETAGGSRQFVMRGAVLNSATTPALFSGSYAGDSETRIEITFTVPDAGTDMCTTKGQVTSCQAALWFGAHIAKGTDWIPVDGRGGAGAINGSPYHVALVSLDGAAVGSRDNQMAASAIPSSITITKQTDPDGDPQVFSFTTTGSKYTGFSLSDDGVNQQIVTSGNYSVTEATVTNWDLVDIVCDVSEQTGSSYSKDLANRKVNITVGANSGASVNCTFYNTYNPPVNLGVITLDKVTVPAGDATSFDFTTTNVPSPIAPSLTDASAPVAWNGLLAGTYTINESALAGWDLTNVACTVSGENSVVTESATGVEIDLATNETVNCTFTNAKLPKLTLLKTVVNNNGGTALDTAWTLSADGPTDIAGVEGSAAVTNAAVEPGSYNLTETGGPAGYMASSYSCVKNGGQAVSGNSITLAYGDVATCTITNDDVAPTLKLVKTVVNDNGGTAVADDWTLTATGNGGFSTAGGSGVLTSVVANVSYALSETGPSGYSASAWSCVGGTQTGATITLGLGESATCTITNDDTAPSLTLNKVVVNNNGGNASASDFTLTATGLTGFNGAGPSVSNGASFDAGAYALSETGPSGYSASAWSCVGGTQTGATITLGLGESATCTITNDDTAPTITLVKVVNTNYGGTAQPNDFNLTVGGESVQSGVAKIVNANTPYALNESVLNGYQFVSVTGTDCPAVLGGTVTLDEGENVTCTVTNEDMPAAISGYKFDDKNANGSWDIAEPALAGWTINLAGTAVGSTVTDANGYYEFTGLSVGNYTVTETQQTGWTQTTQNPAPIALVNGQSVTAVNFGNFKLATIKGAKFSDLDGDGAARENGEPYLAGWTIRLYNDATTPWTLIDTQVTNTSGEYEFSNVMPGTYKVCEVLQAGWIQTFPSITDNNNSLNKTEEGPDCQTVNVDVSGESNTRNFGNYEVQSLTVAKTAETTYTRTFGWTIDKTVTPNELDLFMGDSGTADYTVAVTKDAGTDSAWAVTGTITITNPNPASTNLSATGVAVTDVLSGDIAATVNCPATTVAPGTSMNCTYSTGLPNGENRTNIATVVTTGIVGGGSGQAAVTFGEPTTKVNDSINVTDTSAGVGPWVFTDSDSESYARTFTCGDDEGENDNTATITQTGQSDSARVDVQCYELSVAKTASTTFTRTYGWDIEKVVSSSSLDMFTGDEETVDYTVKVTKDDGTDTGWAVSGQITVTNPAPMPATLASVTDSIAGATVNCPALTVPAGGSLVCTYSSALDSGSAFTNTVTAVQENTPEGTTAYSGSAPVTFDLNNPTVEVLASINVDDTNGDSWEFSDDDEVTYERTFSCAPGGDGEGEYGNTATIVETEQSDDANVTVTCYDLSVTKTATPTYTRTFDWDITKEVDNADVDLFTGDSQTVHYTVKVTKKEGVDSDFAVAGTIAVNNPAPIDATLTGVSDVVSGAGAMAVTCPVSFPYILKGGESLNCTYSGALPDEDDRTNTATAVLANTPEGTTDYTGSANVDFGEPTTLVNNKVNVTDTYEGVLGETDETKTYTYERELSCVADTDGDEIDETGAGEYPNTAEITETGDEASQSVTVECYNLNVQKTADTSYTRTFDWDVVKTANPSTLDLMEGDSGVVDYTVTVTKGVGTDSDHKVFGTITVTNPAPMAATINSVSDVLPGDLAASVVCPGTAPYEVAGDGGTLICTYEKAVNGVVEGVNTASAVLQNSPEGTTNFTGTAVVDFGEPTTLVNNEVVVTDTMKHDALGTTTGSTEYTYKHTFTCDADEGVKGNTATATGDEEVLDTDDASVAVNCYDLTITKTANTSFTRTYAWDIEKVGDASQLILSPDQVHAVNYDVTVTNTGATDSQWTIAGTVTVKNDSPIAATLSGVSDTLSDYGAVPIECGVAFPYVLGPGMELSCTYTVLVADATARSNDATVALDNGTEYTGSANAVFSATPTTEVDECINVTDDKYGSLGTVCKNEAPKTFDYSLNVSYNNTFCGLTPQYVNTATLTTNDTSTTDSDAWTIDVQVVCTCTLTQGYWKTHSREGKAPYDDGWKKVGLNEEDTTFFNSGTTWYNVFWTPVKGNVYYQLAHQYMAAKLNVLNGAAAPQSVVNALAQAEALLSAKTPAQMSKVKGTEKNTWTNLAGLLGSYNEGLIGPGHCTEARTY